MDFEKVIAHSLKFEGLKKKQVLLYCLECCNREEPFLEHFAFFTIHLSYHRLSL